MDTPTPVNILGIAGSLRQGSYNRALLRAARIFCPREAAIEIIELDGIPPFNQDHELDPPESVVHLKALVRSSDAVLFATPEYNYSFSGVLKNAIDWGTRPYGDNAWAGKPAAIMGASTGQFGTVRAQLHLRQVLQGINMLPLTRPEVMVPEAASKFDPEGNLVNEQTMALVTRLIQGLVQLTLQMRKA
ncbi:MAG TPA: NADPH-dependent FMN reductase [Deltaproteobacteria bacterium]|jgi:chromate reductase|nr:NADPH-dependent FMN reductase [Deltaproteobacteria bacterium]HOI05606.1 NADPH-dependent FMN reductase [Deltaproteobacteria bacterium]